MTADGLMNVCKECRFTVDSDRESRKRLGLPPDNDRRKRSLKNAGLIFQYGITLAEYEQMLVDQDGMCAVCHGPEVVNRSGKIISLAVDHCHSTGKVRGLLCRACNSGIGHFADDIERIMSAIEYLKNNRASGAKGNT